MNAFLDALDRLPVGYSEGLYRGTRWAVTLSASSDERRRWLWGEELGGAGRVSFNLYMLESGPALRPCEMPAEDVVAFVLGYEPEDAQPAEAVR
ncbi:MAG: hypothetical protein AVDCRST_MAG91-2274 [uncultured Sphingomonadaceae bacterium]|uniref:Peptide methionine sulfoxide reductase n=1 Tax=uncultured Sphingomonadaceae bacterium TaxID=169976 RepID=A0A6J4TH07_9SPHN|nr:MAG: hypothetical protein AVDCRST_MAG91-2274 [uncultured Sphingomonadaceae bacterium]